MKVQHSAQLPSANAWGRAWGWAALSVWGADFSLKCFPLKYGFIWTKNFLRNLSEAIKFHSDTCRQRDLLITSISSCQYLRSYLRLSWFLQGVLRIGFGNQGEMNPSEPIEIIQLTHNACLFLMSLCGKNKTKQKKILAILIVQTQILWKKYEF